MYSNFTVYVNTTPWITKAIRRHRVSERIERINECCQPEKESRPEHRRRQDFNEAGLVNGVVIIHSIHPEMFIFCISCAQRKKQNVNTGETTELQIKGKQTSISEIPPFLSKFWEFLYHSGYFLYTRTDYHIYTRNTEQAPVSLEPERYLFAPTTHFNLYQYTSTICPVDQTNG